jgi:transcriptional regulator with XRE-family HTH domain
LGSDTPGSGSFAQRLNHLFETVHPKGRGPYSNPEAAKAINQAAGEQVISPTYIWQLRTGKKDNPTRRHIIALATFFNVSPNYFFEPDTDDSGTTIRAEVQVALQDHAVTSLALKAQGLSDETLKMIQGMVDRARAIEGLPEVDD